MPTFDRIGPYRFFVYAGDRDEPPHIHVEQESKIAKFWFDPVRLQRSGGFSRRDIGRIQRIVRENEQRFVEAWHEYFNG